VTPENPPLTTMEGKPMSHDSAVLFDYRRSHLGDGRGATYDRLYRPGSALAFYWENFERPYLEATFRELRAAHPDARYLDFACGTGRILQVAAPYFRSALGIDVSEGMLSQARAKVPTARLERADVLTEPVDVGMFDVITVFRFILRAGPALREGALRWLRSVISDDGTLIVNNHRNARSQRGIAYRIETTIRPNGFEDELLSDHQVARLLDRCGFRIVASYGFGGVPSWRGRLVLPPATLLPVERWWTEHRTERYSKNRIYVCRPVV
jgi:SAM-dependent methyltransferase